jgi:hypothetical protein
MTERIKDHFPYPHNPLNEGEISLTDPQAHSDILAADAAALDGGPITEPLPVITERRFTAPSIGGGNDVLDRSQAEQDKILKGEIAPAMPQVVHNPAQPGMSEREQVERADVGMIDLKALQRRLAETATQANVRPMHIDGRTPGHAPTPGVNYSKPVNASNINDIVPERYPRQR